MDREPDAVRAGDRRVETGAGTFDSGETVKADIAQWNGHVFPDVGQAREKVAELTRRAVELTQKATWSARFHAGGWSDGRRYDDAPFDPTKNPDEVFTTPK